MGEEPKKVKLKTIDEVTFEVEPSIAKEMETVPFFINVGVPDASAVIPLPNVSSRDLGRIIEYCSEHSRSADAGNLEEFRRRFVAALSLDELKDLLSAANYLNVKNLTEFLYKSMADIIKDKSVKFVMNFFGLDIDYTPEEEAQIRQENAWAFD